MHSPIIAWEPRKENALQIRNFHVLDRLDLLNEVSLADGEVDLIGGEIGSRTDNDVVPLRAPLPADFAVAELLAELLAEVLADFLGELLADFFLGDFLAELLADFLGEWIGDFRRILRAFNSVQASRIRPSFLRR